MPIRPEVRDAVREKQKIWRAISRDETKENYEKNSKARNKVRKLTRNCVRIHEEDKPKSIKLHPKKFWNYVNEKIESTGTIPALKISDNNWTKTDKEKATALSDFFNSVFTIETSGSLDLKDLQEQQISDDLYLSKEVILHELAALDATKSMRADKVHAKILNECRYELAELLCSLMQNSWDKGEIPEDWKCANITAIHKKDAKSDPNNCRPLSLTSICCKIIEKMIRKHLFDFLRQNNILSDKQYGFIPGRSTNLQLLKALKDWIAELDNGFEVDIVYIYFQKAFDIVTDERLLNTISKYGIKGKTLS